MAASKPRLAQNDTALGFEDPVRVYEGEVAGVTEEFVAMLLQALPSGTGVRWLAENHHEGEELKRCLSQ